MSQWIRVEDRLPENQEDVIAWGSSGIFIGNFHVEWFGPYWSSHKMDHLECTEEYEPVTHWMPLPKPPEVK